MLVLKNFNKTFINFKKSIKLGLQIKLQLEVEEIEELILKIKRKQINQLSTRTLMITCFDINNTITRKFHSLIEKKGIYKRMTLIYC